MIMTPVIVDRCPLCEGVEAVEDSIPQPNAYSESLAVLTDRDEELLLLDHTNWRCLGCGLVYKRRWFSETVIRDLFTGTLGAHPKGWDSVLGRFSASGFHGVMERWSAAVQGGRTPEIRRGERELRSIVGAVSEPVGFEPEGVLAAIERSDVGYVRSAVGAITASMSAPASFTRFAGFRSQALWDYLQRRSGGFHNYAEVGCPLWGLLHLAVAAGADATYLVRDEMNYWGSACLNSGEHCKTHLLRDTRIRSAHWNAANRYQLVGVFQYLDHPSDPVGFLRELFGKADAAAFILDAMEAPVAIQHMTGWTDTAIAYVAESFGRRVHADFADIRSSGNRLYLLSSS